jgi:hypothetical protein
MANRRMFQFRLSLQRDIVDLTVKAAIGATGAPTISTTDAKGITSITRNSAGNYTILLQDNYAALMTASAVVLCATASAAPITQLISEQVSNSTTPRVILQCLDAAGAAADPDSGSTLMVHLMLRNAST